MRSWFSTNFSREIEVCQNKENKSGNFSREFEVSQNNVNKSDNFSREIEVLGTYSGSNTAASQAINASLFSIIILIWILNRFFLYKLVDQMLLIPTQNTNKWTNMVEGQMARYPICSLSILLFVLFLANDRPEFPL